MSRGGLAVKSVFRPWDDPVVIDRSTTTNLNRCWLTPTGEKAADKGHSEIQVKREPVDPREPKENVTHHRLVTDHKPPLSSLSAVQNDFEAVAAGHLTTSWHPFQQTDVLASGWEIAARGLDIAAMAATFGHLWPRYRMPSSPGNAFLSNPISNSSQYFRSQFAGKFPSENFGGFHHFPLVNPAVNSRNNGSTKPILSRHKDVLSRPTSADGFSRNFASESDFGDIDVNSKNVKSAGRPLVKSEILSSSTADRSKIRRLSPDSLRGSSSPSQRPKRFGCEVCGARFSNNGQLAGHLRIHTGERPFACRQPGCAKRFTRNEELTRHKRIHTGVKPFPCPAAGCRKRFGRKDHLKKHAKTHQQQQQPERPVYTGGLVENAVEHPDLVASQLLSMPVPTAVIQSRNSVGFGTVLPVAKSWQAPEFWQGCNLIQSSSQ